jgi:carbon monoxide dehydrogenase subunit G
VKLENAFEVPAPIEQVWDFMLDVPRVAPCMPGCELTDVVDERTWKGKVNVKLGPVSLSYAGKAVMVERDDASHRVVLKADGTETRGKGTAAALVTSHMERIDGGTRVMILTELSLSGAVAQLGRGMIGDVSQRLTDEFAETLKERMAAGAPGAGASEAPEAMPEAKPLAGIRLGLWAVSRAITRFFSRIWRAISSPFRRSR